MGWVMTGPPRYWRFTTGGLHGATVAPPTLLGGPMGRASGAFLEWFASALVAGGTPTSAVWRLLRSNVGYVKCLASIGSNNKLRNNGIRATTVIIFINTDPRRGGIPAALTIFGIHKGNRWIRNLQWLGRLASLVPENASSLYTIDAGPLTRLIWAVKTAIASWPGIIVPPSVAYMLKGGFRRREVVF